MPIEPTSQNHQTPESALYGQFRQASEEEADLSHKPRPWPLIALAVLCAALIIAGGFGPWFHIATPDPHTLAGVQTDGLIAIIPAPLAVVALAIALVRPNAGLAAWASVVLFAICALTGLIDWLSLGSTATGTGVSVLWGVPVVTLAGAMGTLCALLIARRLNRY